MRKKATPASLLASCLIAAAIGVAAGSASLAEKIGQVSQPLVAGTEVSAQEQQNNALVAVKVPGASCSGSLLNSEWVISAAHCFLDPTVAAAQVKITANWPTVQKRTGKVLFLFDKDIAIVRVDKPFDISPSYNMPVYTGTISPGRNLTIYGRGIYDLARRVGGKAVETKSDGKYRTADFQVSHVDGDHMWFSPNKGGAIPAGGDSGGPAFINAGGKSYLAGISSECQTHDLDGMSDPNDEWKWVDRIDECGYAPLAAVWADIQQRIGTPSCRGYAWAAVGTLQLAKTTYNCDPAVLTGARWSPRFDDHLKFCMGANPADVKSEQAARSQIAQECRIAAAMPHGTVALKVAAAGDAFQLSGSGYEVNSRVIIRTSGAAAIQKNITSNFSDPQGNFAATIPMASVCASAGTITFTAEDQDKPASAPVNETCKAPGAVAEVPPNPEPEPPAAEPPPPPKKKFVTVKLAVDIYPAPGGDGEATGTLEAGTKSVSLVEPCSDGWCHVRWPEGEGWVYSASDYQSLKLP